MGIKRRSSIRKQPACRKRIPPKILPVNGHPQILVTKCDSEPSSRLAIPLPIQSQRIRGRETLGNTWVSIQNVQLPFRVFCT